MGSLHLPELNLIFLANIWEQSGYGMAIARAALKRNG
jgi:hypothetical protein